MNKYQLIILLCFLALILCQNIAWGQKNNTIANNLPSARVSSYYTQALHAFDHHDAEEVEKWCNKAIKEDPYYIEPYRLLAFQYDRLRQYDDQKNILRQLISQVPDKYEGYWDLAGAEDRAGEIDSALKHYEMALSIKDMPASYKKMAEERVKAIKIAIGLINHPVPFNPINVGKPINSKYDEYLPTITVDGQDFYFTRKLPDPYSVGGINEDLFVSHKKDSVWQEPQGVDNVNTEDNEGAMSIAPDGSYMVFTGCERPDGEGSCDLYLSFFVDGKWTKPVNMGPPVNTKYKETQPSISYDGRSIYFSSDRPGTYGKLDIWVTTRDNNWNFSEPVNLGPAVNTDQNEQTPFIHPDNQTLYFTSYGHAGVGKNDIFFARKNTKGEWDSVTNIGYPINTTGEEAGLMVDPQGEYAYISSDRPGGYGGLDIYRFKLYDKARPHPVTYLKGSVLDVFKNTGILATIELVDLVTGESVIKTNSHKDGSFLIALPTGKDYLVNVSADGYLFYSDHIPLKDYKETTPFVHDVAMQPIKPGSKIVLKNIFFNTDAYELKKESDVELDKLAAFMKANPTLKIEISGHTDNTGTKEHNITLSTQRAKAVSDYLTKTSGISPGRITSKGYGDAQPIADNSTEAGKAQNRRTEVKIVD